MLLSELQAELLYEKNRPKSHDTFLLKINVSKSVEWMGTFFLFLYPNAGKAVRFFLYCLIKLSMSMTLSAIVLCLFQWMAFSTYFLWRKSTYNYQVTSLDKNSLIVCVHTSTRINKQSLQLKMWSIFNLKYNQILHVFGWSNGYDMINGCKFNKKMKSHLFRLQV